MPRYKLTIEYDGTGLAGWQRQPDRPSVQEHVEAALEAFCGEQVEAICAGRTDAGVHARGQVAHCDFAREHDSFTVMQAVNAHLRPHRIAVVEAERVSGDFHARFSATQRHYCYHILNRRARPALEEHRVWHMPVPLDTDLMRGAGQLLRGTHDFTSFRSTICQAKSPVKTLESIKVWRIGDDVRIHVGARSFLHNQVRIIAGSLVMIGRGKWRAEDLARALRETDRRAAGPTAPPHGLYLMRVEY